MIALPVAAIFTQSFLTSLVAGGLLAGVPLMFTALGEQISEASGVLNIGLEGMMLTGAFFGILAADKLDSWELGLLVAILSGGAMALLHAVWSIHFRADQIISGFAVNVLAVGLTGYLFIDIYGQEGTPSDIPSIPNIHLAFLDGVPVELEAPIYALSAATSAGTTSNRSPTIP